MEQALNSVYTMYGNFYIQDDLGNLVYLGSQHSKLLKVLSFLSDNLI